jgi:hypothetical protein
MPIGDGTLPVCSTPGQGSSEGPAPLGDHAGALNATGSLAVFFGGDTSTTPCGAAPTAKFTGETWILDVACSRYRKVTSDAPTMRAKHAMVSAGDKVYLFGGRSRTASAGPYVLYNDLWAFSFATESWEQVSATGDIPTARASTAMAYDKAKNRLVLFGGNSSPNGLNLKPEADTYTFDLATSAWTKARTSGTPKARIYHSLTVDPNGGKAYALFGGDANAFQGPFINDLWALDLQTFAWEAVDAQGDKPLARINAASFYDESRKRVMLFGGHDDGELGNTNDLLELDVSVRPAVWSKLPGGDVFANKPNGTCDFPANFTTVDKTVPERRAQFAAAPRLDGKSFLIMGGKTDCGAASDVWWWSSQSSAWSTVKATPLGLSCLRFSTTCTSLCN